MPNRLVTSSEEVVAAVARFNADAAQKANLATAKDLLRTTTYWLRDANTGLFAPSKYVGFGAESLRTYPDRRESASGTATREAIEKATGLRYAQLPLQSQLRTWGEQVAGTDVFAGVDADKWRFLVLNEDNAEPALPLTLHRKYGRKEAFAAVGDTYSPQEQNKNTGLSPRNPDGGHFIFITLNKEDFDPAFDYPDELGTDWFSWTTRRDRREDHPEYVHLRQPSTRKSLFVRNEERQPFTYLGELNYISHEAFKDAKTDRDQQEYLFGLRVPVPDALLAELTFGIAGSGKKPKEPAPAATQNKAHRKQKPRTLGDAKLALSYALGRVERTMVPAHHNYQVRLRTHLESRKVTAVWEKNFVDLEFTLDGQVHIGEVKVTTTLRLEEAFRAALGQLIEYSHLRYKSAPVMTMFLDARLDSQRLGVATKFGIAVVCEVDGAYELQNPGVSQLLGRLFSAQAAQA